jgi:hypothetical protein
MTARGLNRGVWTPTIGLFGIPPENPTREQIESAVQRLVNEVAPHRIKEGDSDQLRQELGFFSKRSSCVELLLCHEGVLIARGLF